MRHLRVNCITFISLVSFSTYFSSGAHAEYAVQVGAFGKPSQAFADSAQALGEVNTAQTDDGITVFTVGRYMSVDAAKADLDRIQESYPDAFVRNMPTGARRPQDLPQSPSSQASSAQAPAQGQAPNNTSVQASSSAGSRYVSGTANDSDLWNSLSDEERRRVVYLDGVLHVKQGESFVPLADFRRDSANQ